MQIVFPFPTGVCFCQTESMFTSISLFFFQHRINRQHFRVKPCPVFLCVSTFPPPPRFLVCKVPPTTNTIPYIMPMLAWYILEDEEGEKKTRIKQAALGRETGALGREGGGGMMGSARSVPRESSSEHIRRIRKVRVPIREAKNSNVSPRENTQAKKKTKNSGQRERGLLKYTSTAALYSLHSSLPYIHHFPSPLPCGTCLVNLLFVRKNEHSVFYCGGDRGPAFRHHQQPWESISEEGNQ
jgi:hypothetical protein